MINSNFANDYVLATGKSYTIKEFCEITAKNLEIDLVWKGKGIGTKGVNKNTGKIIIEIDRKFYRPSEVDFLIGDAKKAKKELKWNPKTNFKELINIMVDFEKNLHK